MGERVERLWPSPSSRLRELREGLVDNVLSDGSRRSMLDVAIFLDHFDADALDQIPCSIVTGSTPWWIGGLSRVTTSRYRPSWRI